MPSQTHSLLPYFASGAFHLTAVGLVWMGLGWDGYLPPTVEVRWGEMNSQVSSTWAPEARAPIDEGPLVTVLGVEQPQLADDSFVLQSAVIQVLRQPTTPIDEPTPPEAERRKSIDPQAIVDQQQVSLSEPIRLDEPAIPKRPAVKVVPAPEPNLLVTKTTTSEPSIEEPPVPESLDRPVAVAVPAPQPPVTVVTTKSLSPMNVVPGTKTGATESTQRQGQATGTAEMGQTSQASTAAVSSELPPGARADQLPTKLASNAAPAYPPEAYQQGQEGTVTLLVTVSSTGTVGAVRVARSSGFKLLDAAALSTVERWRFTPATYQGRNVQVRVAIPIRFNLADGVSP